MIHQMWDKNCESRPSVDPERLREATVDPARQEVRRVIIARAHTYPSSGKSVQAKKRLRLRKQAFRYEFCGVNYIRFKCKDCGEKVFGRNRCESRICERCARKYANRIRSKQTPLVNALQPTRTKRLMFLTVTKRIGKGFIPTTEHFRQLMDEFKVLSTKFYPKKSGSGSLATLEVGRGWNIHVHAIVYGEFVHQKTLSDAWLRITGDSSIVYITQVRRPQRAVNYLLKYIAKPPKFESVTDLAIYLDAISGLRRIRTFGIFYNFKILRHDRFVCAICGGRIAYDRSLNPVEINEEVKFFSEENRMIN